MEINEKIGDHILTGGTDPWTESAVETERGVGYVQVRRCQSGRHTRRDWRGAHLIRVEPCRGGVGANARGVDRHAKTHDVAGSWPLADQVDGTNPVPADSTVW